MNLKIIKIIALLCLSISCFVQAKSNCDEMYKGYTHHINIEGKTQITIYTPEVCGNNLNTSLKLKDSIITIIKDSKILAKFYTRHATYFKNRQKIITSEVLPLEKLSKGLRARSLWNIDLQRALIRAPRGIYYKLN